jgi:NAD(P)-dependent dehydrogenase (short-subunit alcohol dehydrogenase family)
MKGKTVLITGATSGIGKETAIGMARLGAMVVIAGRDEKKGNAAKYEIIRLSNNASVKFFFCDLASFESIRSFCKAFKTRFAALHVLINNAGVWNFKRRETKDGIENTFAVNYLAPFLMTTLLLDLLKKSAPSRIVNVSSGLHRGTINFNDIEYRNSFSGVKAYSQSKLALILFTKLLAKNLRGTGITVNAVHPGFVSTGLGREASAFLRACFRIFGKSASKGARTSLYVASAPEIEYVSGEYFADNKISRTSRQSYDLDAAGKLWRLSEKYVGSR